MKWRLRNKRRNSILMTCHYPDPGTASDWLCHLWNFLQPIESTTSLGSDTSSVWNFCTCFSDFISWRNCWWHREMSSVFSGYCYGWELGHSTVANLNGWNKSLTRCLPSINQSINQSFILTRYIKELKNSFNWNNWGQRDPCYSIICKLKRSECDYTQAPVFEAAWVDSMNLVKLSVFLSCVVSYVYLLCAILFSVWLQLHRFVLNVKVSQYHTCTFLMKSCCRYFPFCHTKTWHLALEFAVSSIVYPWMKPCVSFCHKSFINLASVVQKLDRAIHRINLYPVDKY